MNPMPKIQNPKSRSRTKQCVSGKVNLEIHIRKNSSIQDQMNLTDEVVLDESNA